MTPINLSAAREACEKATPNLAAMRKRAAAWVFDAGTGELTSRAAAINEQIMALDVMDLANEVEWLTETLAQCKRERDEAVRVVEAADEWLAHLEQNGARYLDGIPGELCDAVDAYRAWRPTTSGGGKSAAPAAPCDERDAMRAVVDAGIKWAPTVRAKANHARMPQVELNLYNAIRRLPRGEGGTK